MPDRSKFTPTQLRILRVLSDGQGHRAAEMMACLDDELAAEAVVKVHISNIRKHLRPIGHDIVCRQGLYTHVRLIPYSSQE